MSDPIHVVGLEIMVASIDDAVAVMTEGFGWDLVFRGPAGEIDGERAVLNAGSIMVTLLEPFEHGSKVVADREPRVTQLVLGDDAARIALTTDRLMGLGVPTREGGKDRRYVPPEAVAGILGFETAFMLQRIDGSAGAGGVDDADA